jgi:UDP-N-acetylglucosamine 3-dehydrogenase
MRIGILGAGDMGRVHASVYASMSGVEIAGIVGRTRARAASLAGEVGAPALTDPWMILDDDSVDAIDVTFPSGLHRQWTIAALERGKHVFCETPMALTLEDADAMIAAAREHQRILMPAQVHRFGVEAAFIHNEVVAGSLGRPLSAYAGSRSPFYGSGERRPIDLYGGPMLDLMIHPIDTLNWLLGTPIQVMGTGRVGPSGTIDYAFVALDFENASGLAEGCAMMPESFPFSIGLRVLCEQGALEASISLGPTEVISLVRYPAKGQSEQLSLEGVDPYTDECKHFVDCVRNGADTAPASLEGERDALRVALAAQQALQQGAPVSLKA